MYCRNCGYKISDNAEVCTNCGFKPLTGNSYCQNCGAETKEKQVICVECGVELQDESTISSEGKSKVAAGVLAIILGALGVHKFYLGYMNQGFVMLLVTIIGSILTLGLAAAIMGTIGLVEGIIYLTKSDKEFYQEYVKNKKPWF
ncbi:MAG: NINE protein [Candidatus Cloacimonetes bacterium]|nr:NINE protein [Candidatus Cloacimonadota bacterium]